MARNGGARGSDLPRGIDSRTGYVIASAKRIYGDVQLGERTWAVCDLKSKIPCSIYFFSNLFLLWSDNLLPRILNVLFALHTRLKAIFERE
jgi:hypothetical protein